MAQANELLQQAQAGEQRFRGDVDQFTSATFQGARFHRLSAPVTSQSATDFLDRMSALAVLSADRRAALDGYTGSVNLANQARKTKLDGKIREVRAALNRPFHERRRALHRSTSHRRLRSSNL